MIEYGVHYKSNDGKEEHIGGHYRDLKKAIERANVRKGYGNKDVYIVARDVTDWSRLFPDSIGL